MIKQTIGWNRPQLRDPAVADRWTWIVIAANTQLRLARHLVEDLRRPWEKPVAPGRLSPARVRRGFRNIHPMITRLSHNWGYENVKGQIRRSASVALRVGEP